MRVVGAQPFRDKGRFFVGRCSRPKKTFQSSERLLSQKTGETVVLVDQNLLLTIAEEYATCGIEEVHREVANQPGLPQDNLVQFLFRNSSFGVGQ